MGRLIPAAVAAALACAPPTAAQTPQTTPSSKVLHVAKAARARLARCGDGGRAFWQLPDKAWTARAVDLKGHRELRARYGLPMPKGQTMIALYSWSAHHTLVRWSTVAVRGADGRWTASDVAEEGGGLIGGAMKLDVNAIRVLPAEAGATLDRAIADRCLYAEPTLHYAASGMPGVGAPHNDLAVVTPRRSWTAAYFVKAFGRTEAIYQALFVR